MRLFRFCAGLVFIDTMFTNNVITNNSDITFWRRSQFWQQGVVGIEHRIAMSAAHQTAPGSKVILADPEGSAAFGTGGLHSGLLKLGAGQAHPTIFRCPQSHGESRVVECNQLIGLFRQNAG
jgi:hypothetical protein